MLKLAFQSMVGRVGCFWCFSVGAVSFEWTQGSWGWTSDVLGWIPRVNECTLGAWRWIAGAGVCTSWVWRSGDEMSECLGVVGGYMNWGSRHPMLNGTLRASQASWRGGGHQVRSRPSKVRARVDSHSAGSCRGIGWGWLLLNLMWNWSKNC